MTTLSLSAAFALKFCSEPGRSRRVTGRIMASLPWAPGSMIPGSLTHGKSQFDRLLPGDAPKGLRTSSTGTTSYPSLSKPVLEDLDATTAGNCKAASTP